MSGPGAAPASDPWFAVADVSVSGRDVSGIALVLQPGVSVAGRVEFDAATEPLSATPVPVIQEAVERFRRIFG
jgi:hypothetical protein